MIRDCSNLTIRQVPVASGIGVPSRHGGVLNDLSAVVFFLVNVVHVAGVDIGFGGFAPHSSVLGSEDGGQTFFLGQVPVMEAQHADTVLDGVVWEF